MSTQKLNEQLDSALCTIRNVYDQMEIKINNQENITQEEADAFKVLPSLLTKLKLEGTQLSVRILHKCDVADK